MQSDSLRARDGSARGRSNSNRAERRNRLLPPPIECALPCLPDSLFELPSLELAELPRLRLWLEQCVELFVHGKRWLQVHSELSDKCATDVAQVRFRLPWLVVVYAAGVLACDVPCTSGSQGARTPRQSHR